jgi:hypothetical protein
MDETKIRAKFVGVNGEGIGEEQRSHHCGIWFIMAMRNINNKTSAVCGLEINLVNKIGFRLEELERAEVMAVADCSVLAWDGFLTEAMPEGI